MGWQGSDRHGRCAGVGRAVSLRLAEMGASVVINDIQEDKLDSVAQEIRANGGEALAVRADVGIQSDVEKLVAQAETTFGRIDTLINNAVAYGASRRAT